MDKELKRYDKGIIKSVKVRMIIKMGGRIMATQIAATPIVYGAEARKILAESKTKQSKKAEENAKKLLDFFNKLTS